jgi:hypothetical protein
VAAIDEDSVFFSAKTIEIDALTQRLDEDGITAVRRGVYENSPRQKPR